MPLTDTAVRNAKPDKKPRRLFDGGGLYLEVAPSGGKLWRLKYRFAHKEKRLAFGVYPEVSLKEARDKRDEARALLAQGVDPGEIRKATKETPSTEGTFEAVAREWHARFANSWSATHRQKLLRRLELYVFPWVGARPLNEITAQELLAALRHTEADGRVETAHRALQVCGQVFSYAVQTGRAERNPAADLKGAIPPPSTRNMGAITDPEKVGLLLQAIDGYPGHFVTRCALQLAPLFFLRPGELRKSEWSEIHFDRQELRIPIERMKRRQKEKDARKGELGHIVPLSRQALEILQELYPLTGDGRFLFPGLRSKDRAICDAALVNSLRRLGYAGEEMTVHGFRHLASTLLHEMGWPSHIIEKQLDHADRNRIRAVYNQAEYLKERHKMMQTWADYLDQLKAGKGNKIIPIQRAMGK
ncbi:MAG: integrase arm-type DNA-binding domain-containing protein [Desulfurivibrio sp.]|nr:integrase arm-type DNA-binding domain-containing protein [Desulfurivibrio sp.]